MKKMSWCILGIISLLVCSGIVSASYGNTRRANIFQTDTGKTLVFVDNILIQDATNAYVQMYNYSDKGYNITITLPSTYYNVTGLVAGEIKGFSFQNSAIKVLVSGIYKLDLSYSFSGGSNNEYGIGVAKNYNMNLTRNCYTRETTESSTKVDVAGTTCILNLNQGDILNIQVDDEASPVFSINVHTVQLTVVRIA